MVLKAPLGPHPLGRGNLEYTTFATQEATQVSTDGMWCVCVHSIISLKEEGELSSHFSMEESCRHCAK